MQILRKCCSLSNKLQKITDPARLSTLCDRIAVLLPWVHSARTSSLIALKFKSLGWYAIVCVCASWACTSALLIAQCATTSHDASLAPGCLAFRWNKSATRCLLAASKRRLDQKDDPVIPEIFFRQPWRSLWEPDSQQSCQCWTPRQELELFQSWPRLSTLIEPQTIRSCCRLARCCSSDGW